MSDPILEALAARVAAIETRLGIGPSAGCTRSHPHEPTRQCSGERRAVVEPESGPEVPVGALPAGCAFARPNYRDVVRAQTGKGTMLASGCLLWPGTMVRPIPHETGPTEPGERWHVLWADDRRITVERWQPGILQEAMTATGACVWLCPAEPEKPQEQPVNPRPKHLPGNLSHDWRLVFQDDEPTRYDCRCLTSSPVPYNALCPDAVLEWGRELVATERAAVVAYLRGNGWREAASAIERGDDLEIQ
jgi:hypothetical protein